MVNLLAALIIIYVIILILAYLAQTSLLFHPEKLSSNYKYSNEYYNAEEIFINTSDKETINGIFYKGQSENVILYFHGNAGSLASWQYVYDDFKSLEYNFLIIDYRNYGKSTGELSEKGLYADGQAALDYLKSKGFKEENIIVYGRSIGTGIAIETAKNMDTLKSLILETPYTSMTSLANEKMPYLLPLLILKYRLNNKEKINSIKAPLLIIHGTRDELIPFGHGVALFNEYKGRKEFVKIEDGGHNNLSEYEEFEKGVKRFVEGIN